MGKSIFSRAGLITAEDKKDLEKRLEELEQAIDDMHDVRRQQDRDSIPVSYTHLTLPTTPYV